MTTSPKQAETKTAGEEPVRRRYEIAGIPVAIEFPKGSIKTGVDDKGVAWARTYKHDYGFIDGGPLGGDGEVFDVYVGPAHDAPLVFVVNQLKEDGTYDESKGMLGFPTEAAALMGYLRHYPVGWQESRVGDVKVMTVEEFKAWLKTPGVAKAASQKTASSAQFDQWFTGSKIVDKEGNPLVCYHGSTAEFDQFHIPEHGVAYFTPAKNYGYIEKSKHVYPVYLSIKKPFVTDRQQMAESAMHWPDWIQDLKREGYDGIVYADEKDFTRGPLGWGNDHPQFLVFSPSQVKSAIGNNGAYNPGDARITASAHEKGCVMLQVDEDAARDLMERAQALITDDEVYTDPDDPSFGRETDPHVTALYGIEETHVGDRVQAAIPGNAPVEVTLGKVTYFEGGDQKPYDVIKFDVSPKGCEAFHDILLAEFPDTKQTWAYHPHFTIAYVKAGLGPDICARFQDWEPVTLPVAHVVYSRQDGGKEVFDLDGEWQADVDEKTVKTASPAHWGTAQFDQWFAGSKIVDKEGNPLRVYHGTNTGPREDGKFTPGQGEFIYMTPDPTYAENFCYGQDSQIYALYANAKNPLDLRKLGVRDVSLRTFLAMTHSQGVGPRSTRVTAPARPVFQWVKSPGFKDSCKQAGFDAVWIRERAASGSADALLLFDPKQVKSAIGNRGTYDGEDPRITASVKTAMSAIRLPQEEVDTFVIELHKAILTHLKLAAKSNPLTSKLGEIKTVKGPHKGSFYSFLPTKTYNVSGFSATPVDADSSLYVEGSVLLEAHQTDIDRVVVWGMMSTSKATNSRSEGFNKRGTMRLGLASHMTLGDAIARLQKDKTEAADLRSILVHEITHAFQYLNIDEKPTASGLPRYYKPVGDPFTDAATGRRRQNYQIDEAEYHNDPKEVEALVGQLVDRCRGFYRRRNSKPVSEHDVVTLLKHEPVWVAWSPTLTEAIKREIYKEVYKALVDDKARKAGSTKTADFRDITLQFLRDTGHEHLINEDGSITVYHGTSTKNAKGIETSGKFRGFPFFAIDEATAQKFSRQAGPRPVVLTLQVDPDAVLPTGGEYLSARMEGLHRGPDGVWRLDGATKTSSAAMRPHGVITPKVTDTLARYRYLTPRLTEAIERGYRSGLIDGYEWSQAGPCSGVFADAREEGISRKALTAYEYARMQLRHKWIGKWKAQAERSIQRSKRLWEAYQTLPEAPSLGDLKTSSVVDPESFPLAGPEVDGLTVGEHVPNMGSIAASLTSYTVLDGIRAVPLSAFDLAPYASTSENKRVRDLAGQIMESKRIDPLIVVVDSEGPYVLEGGHRLDALALCKKEHLPAVVVLDHDAAAPKTSAATLTLWHGGNLDSPYDESMAHRKGRAEWGPGLYMSTSWQVAQKYAKGGRKLYRITIAQGNEANDVLIPVEDAREFAKTWGTKARLREVLEAITRRQDRLTADTFLNIMLNYDGLKPAYTGKLRVFLVEHGVDYSIQDNAFGWGERMVVLFNMAKILKKEVIGPKVKLDEFDLPTNWKEASSKVAHPTQWDTPDFKNWFRGSEVVNADGTPKVVYHGAASAFDTFDPKMVRFLEDRGSFFFTDGRAIAQDYADEHESGRVLACYLSLKHPLEVSADEGLAGIEHYDYSAESLQEQARHHGHDGIIVHGAGDVLYIVFSPNQIKSATDNNGKFDPNDNRITASAKVAKPIALPTTDIQHMASLVVRLIQHEAADHPEALWSRREHVGGKGPVITMQYRPSQDWVRPDGTLALHKGEVISVNTQFQGAYVDGPRRYILGGHVFIGGSDAPEIWLRLSGPTLLETYNGWLTDYHANQNTVTLMLLAELRSVLTHEVTHLLDPGLVTHPRADEMKALKEPSYQHGDPAFHNNLSFEARAYVNQCVEEMKDYVRAWGGLWGRSFETVLDEGVRHWSQLKKTLNPENRKLVLKELGRAFNEIKAADGKPVTSALVKEGDREFWGEAGAGCVFVAEDTGRMLLPFRSEDVMEPHTWGTWGGAMDPGEDPQATLHREAFEEASYTGPMQLHKAYTFAQGTFTYTTFVAFVPKEFQPRLNWETSKAQWFEVGQLPTSRLHFGLKAALPSIMQVLLPRHTKARGKVRGEVEDPVVPSATPRA